MSAGRNSWRKQAALFGAAVSALTGLGIFLVLIFAPKAPSAADKKPLPPSHQSQTDR